MRRRALTMVVQSLSAAVALLGLPLAILVPVYLWQSAQTQLNTQAAMVARLFNREEARSGKISADNLSSWLGEGWRDIHVSVTQGGHTLYHSGPRITGRVQTAMAEIANGGTVTLTRSAFHTISTSVFAVIIVIAACGVAFAVGTAIALHGSRRIAAPLIYLAAQAEQLGAGQVQVRPNPSGIEEIDLVQEELVRSSQRMAARLAAERQVASDITHQLRTPLTALSMRIEEINYLSEDEDVRHEAEECLEQVDRVTQVIEDLKRNAQRKQGQSTRALHIDEIFTQQENEWYSEFRAANRQLLFVNEVNDRLPLATPGSLSQALATLIENSLRYGEGTVTVRVRPGTSRRSLFFEVSDEGKGVDDELAPDIFRRGVSGFSSTGIGLALAKDLIEADGGRIELTQRRPPIFTISLSALPASLDPDKVMPKGALVSVGRRGRRR